MSRKSYVFADWEPFSKPILIGVLRSDRLRGKEHFRFSYDQGWLNCSSAQQIDPELYLFQGDQHSQSDHNFRIFLDSSPDRWGRLLMKRREAVIADQEERAPRALDDLDYLLGVHDKNRMGALRFKKDLDGAFLDDNQRLAAPPMASLRELEYAVTQVEKGGGRRDKDYLKWLYMLISPGSSLGGARPKASVIDEKNHLWIAKFPSCHDEIDVAAWEYLAYRLAIEAKITMASSRIDRFHQKHHTFLTQRFDRTKTGRRHFTSALTQLEYYDGDYDASYLEIAQFLMENGSNTKRDLAQLWRRIVFNIAISNSDDHLRNHGFLYLDRGWQLSPAYDLNPIAFSHGLDLCINDNDHRLDYRLAFEVLEFFQLKKLEATKIYDEVLFSVQSWRSKAQEIGLSRQEQDRMRSAFNL